MTESAVSLLGGRKTPLGQRMRWGGGGKGTSPLLSFGPSRHLQTLRSEQPPVALHSGERKPLGCMFALNTHRHGHTQTRTHTINKTKLANNLKPDLFQIN